MGDHAVDERPADVRFEGRRYEFGTVTMAQPRCAVAPKAVRRLVAEPAPDAPGVLVGQHGPEPQADHPKPIAIAVVAPDRLAERLGDAVQGIGPYLVCGPNRTGVARGIDPGRRSELVHAHD